MYTDLGAFYLRAGRWDDAINIFGKFTALAPDDFGAHANLGSAYFYAGRFPEAATAYERSFTLEPNRTALSNTATMYFYSGEFERAAELYLEATKLAPKDHRVWINLADAEAKITGAESAAISHYEQACDLLAEHLQVNEKKTETLALFAWCSVNIGEPEVAELRITEAVTLAGDDPVILYYAAQVNYRLGKRKIAESFVRQALEHGFPSNVMAATPGLSELVPEE